MWMMGPGLNRGASMTKSSKRKRAKARAEHANERANCRAVIKVDRIDLADRFEEGCAQAIGVASLIMEADADVAIQNAAWVIRDLVEGIRNIGRILLKTTSDESVDESRS
jgi:hypothetical protein